MERLIQYIKHTFGHKLSFWKLDNLKSKLVEYGPTFLIILIIVELVEHVGLPMLFYYLGNSVSDFFYVLIPAPLVFCLHFITAPLTFFIYIRRVAFNNKKDMSGSHPTIFPEFLLMGSVIFINFGSIL